ncbi:MAG: hypothetical protein II942_01575 [Alphaproteobacteria bacterium]|nr:hypothetical protein [Alphaproteobacteria bacterium]
MKHILLACVCGFVLVSSPVGAVRHGAPPVIKIEVKARRQLLATRNEALEKALAVHNLMNQMPELEKTAETVRVLRKTTGKMEKYMKALNQCGEKRFSGRFKNAGEMLKKVREAYKTRTADLKSDKKAHPDSIVPLSISEQNAKLAEKRDIENDLMKDVFKNARTWGGDVVDRSSDEAPEALARNSDYNLLEEMNMAEKGLTHAQIGQTQADEQFMKMQQMFVSKLAEFDVQEPELDFIRGTKVTAVHKKLKTLKQQYLDEAKAYISQLDAQDAANPDLVERRAARSQNKQAVFGEIQEQFPDVFPDIAVADQMTPQARQQIIVTALEKDADGEVYMTETNASEVDRRMAEKRANKAMLNKMIDQAYSDFDANVVNREIDLGSC